MNNQSPKVKFDPAMEGHGVTPQACCEDTPAVQRDGDKVRLVCLRCGRGGETKYFKNLRSADTHWRTSNEAWDRARPAKK